MSDPWYINTLFTVHNCNIMTLLGCSCMWRDHSWQFYWWILCWWRRPIQTCRWHVHVHATCAEQGWRGLSFAGWIGGCQTTVDHEFETRDFWDYWITWSVCGSCYLWRWWWNIRYYWLKICYCHVNIFLFVCLVLDCSDYQFVFYLNSTAFFFCIIAMTHLLKWLQLGSH